MKARTVSAQILAKSWRYEQGAAPGIVGQVHSPMVDMFGGGPLIRGAQGCGDGCSPQLVETRERP